MKKKILALCLVAVLVATAAVSGTLAYFTDKDSATNTFTVGNVKIDLQEDFVQNSMLNPGVPVAKKPWVVNQGQNDAYIRVKVDIPSALNGILHLNFINKDLWQLERAPYGVTRDNGATYVEYSFIYYTALSNGEETAYLMDYAVLDNKVDYKDDGYHSNGTKIDYDLTNGLPVIVYAEAIQADGFANATEAFAAFDAQP